ncbi:MAG: trypsin-like peptidase domain-containing protein [Clostridia bacterium]|nr:trypsin-like peptidase domain-containing protein [Clostridia bacterium]
MKKIVCLLLPVLLVLSLVSCTVFDGKRGGPSAYEVAVENGYKGDEVSWLESLKGKDLSLSEVYAAARDAGFEGDLLDFLKEYLSYDDGDLVLSGVAPVSAGISGSLLSSVSITCTFDCLFRNWFGTSTQTKQQSGSGVIYRLDKEQGDAYIITNYHVVYRSDSLTENKISDRVKVYLYGSESERYAIDATYVGGSMNYDIAVLKITGSEVLKRSSALPVSVADSNLITVGDVAIAIGNPVGIGISATSGIVSVDSESIQMQACDNVSIVSYRLLRVDTAINEGNSGGGLFDKD